MLTPDEFDALLEEADRVARSRPGDGAQGPTIRTATLRHILQGYTLHPPKPPPGRAVVHGKVPGFWNNGDPAFYISGCSKFDQKAERLEMDWTQVTCYECLKMQPHIALLLLRMSQLQEGQPGLTEHDLLEELSRLKALTAHMDSQWGWALSISPARSLPWDEQEKMRQGDRRDLISTLRGSLKLGLVMIRKILGALPKLDEKGNVIEKP